MANPFFIQSESVAPQLQQLGGLIGQYGQQQRQQQAQEQQAQKIAELQEVMKGGDMNKVADFMIANPDMSQQIQANMMRGLGVKNQIQEDQLKKDTFKMLGDPQNITSHLQTRISEIEGRGGDATETKRELAEYQTNPEAFQKGLETLAITKFSPEWKQWSASTEDGAIPQTATQKDFAQYQELTKTDPEAAKQFGVKAGFVEPDKPKKLFQVRKNDDGSITKYYSDGTEDVATPKEKVKTPDMRSPMSYSQAEGIISNAKEGPKKTAGFASSLRESIDGMGKLIEYGNVDPSRAALINKALGDGTAANLTLSEGEQEYLTHAKEALFSVLRPQTGAAITTDEMKEYSKIYLPQPGDKKGTIDLKNKKLEGQFKSLRGSAGKVYEASRVYGGYEDRKPQQSDQTKRTASENLVELDKKAVDSGDYSSAWSF